MCMQLKANDSAGGDKKRKRFLLSKKIQKEIIQ